MTTLSDSFPTQFAPLPHSEMAALCSLAQNRANSESTKAWLGLLNLAEVASQELECGTPESTLDGVISRVVLRSLLGALYHRDMSTVRHSRRVALLAVGLANHLGWDWHQSRVLEVAALLHDIGKIGVPDSVLHKPGKLNSDEVELMALSFNIGSDILQSCRVDPQVIAIIDQAQQGSTAGSSGQRTIGREIHMGARILAVADAYESLVTEQAYRRAKNHEEIMELLAKESGRQFDGNIVSSLARWIQKDGLPFAAQNLDLSDVIRSRDQIDPTESEEARNILQIFSYLHTLEALYDGFHLVDSECKLLIWSRGAESLLERPADEVLGKTWSPSLLGYRDSQGNEIPPEQSLLRRVLATGKTEIEQIQAVRTDGALIEIELQAIPVFDERGQFKGAAELIRNTQRTGGKRPHEFRELKLAATRDSLTNVANRGELENQLSKLIKGHTEGREEAFSVIFADVDHFKRINDTYGHGVGDQVLIDLSKLWTRETYSGELVARYGGEEFVILCPSTDLEQAIRRAERLRHSLRESKIGGVDRLRVTASFGVSQIEPGDTVESVLNRADKALYNAKSGGRDKTCSLARTDDLLQDKESNENGETHDPHLFSGRFVALVNSDMIIYKLGGFVTEHKASITEVKPERVVLKLGTTGLLSFLEWGSPPPVEIVISLTGLGDSKTREAAQRVDINVSVHSLNHRVKSNLFHSRASGLFRELKQYFASVE